MAETFLRHSALAALGLGARTAQDAEDPARAGAGVWMGERPFRRQAGLRGDVGDAAFCAAVKKALGAEPPAGAHQTAGPADLTNGVRILWLGPDEWLCAGHPDSELDPAGALSAALTGLHAAAWDISGSRTVIWLSGPNARDVLAKGCALDLHPSVFQPGHVIAGHVALAHAEIDYVQDGPEGEPVFELYVHRSFAEYLWTWLEDAALEYGLRVVEEA
ncbi:MAG: sarcosine oxidase subunit gamma [Rhodospirillales bacterium]